MRLGVQLFAAIGICGVSWGLGGGHMWIGLPLGAGLAFHAVFLGNAPKSMAVLGIPVVPMVAAQLLALHDSLSTGAVAMS